jgi:hypothetical protein
MRIATNFLVLALGLGGCCVGGGASPPLSLAPGFAPQPMTQSGMALGVTDASTLNPSCVGLVPNTPQHTVNVTAPIPNLRIMVRSAADTTLVVRLPDGSYRCNDDTEDLHPLVEGPVPVGTLQVFVGAFSTDSTGTVYTIGFTEQADTLPSMLP